MESAHFNDLTLEEINQFFGLSANNDFLKYIDKYDNGLTRMDRNRRYTAYLKISDVSYVIVFSHDALGKIRNKNEKGSPILRLIKTKEGYTSKEKLDKVKQMFNNTIIKYYDITTTNVYVSYLNDEESEMYEAWDKHEEKNYPDIYDDDIPYLGLPDDEQEIGHWNID